jgi:hypothetical protein
MAMVDTLWLATLTRRENNADTDTERLNLTVNVDGEDLVDTNFYFPSMDRGGAGLSGGPKGVPALPLDHPIEASLLTNSSIRLGIRSDDAWGPGDVLVLGKTERQTIALAMETEIGHWLSTDLSEGKLTMPLRLVGQGSSSTLLRRVLLLAFTAWGNEEYGSNDPIEIEIAASGSLVLQHEIVEPRFTVARASWFLFDAPVPFTRGGILSNGSIHLNMKGNDAWMPKVLFLYGLDTATGRPNEVVHLVSIPEWGSGLLSADPGEGSPSVQLPVV